MNKNHIEGAVEQGQRARKAVAALSRRWWHNSLSAFYRMLTTACFDSLGLPRLA